MPLANTVAKNIRMFRLQRGLTQEALAKKTGWQPTYVNRLERNPQNLSLQTMELLAKVLKIHPAQLLADGELPFNSNATLVQFHNACDILQSIREQAVAKSAKPSS